MCTISKAASIELGVSVSALGKWVREHRSKGAEAFPGSGNLSVEEKKVRELEKKVRRLEMEREILKKDELNESSRNSGFCELASKRFLIKPSSPGKDFKVSIHKHPVTPNLLGRYFQVSKPNQVWTGDITFIPTRQGWLYLAVVIDLFARKVVGWQVGNRINSILVVDALRTAIRTSVSSNKFFHYVMLSPISKRSVFGGKTWSLAFHFGPKFTSGQDFARSKACI